MSACLGASVCSPEDLDEVVSAYLGTTTCIPKYYAMDGVSPILRASKRIGNLCTTERLCKSCFKGVKDYKRLCKSHFWASWENVLNVMLTKKQTLLRKGY